MRNPRYRPDQRKPEKPAHWSRGLFQAMEISEKSKVLRTCSWSTFFTSAKLSRGTSWSTNSDLGATPGVTWVPLPESPGRLPAGSPGSTYFTVIPAGRAAVLDRQLPVLVLGRVLSWTLDPVGISKDLALDRSIGKLA